MADADADDEQMSRQSDEPMNRSAGFNADIDDDADVYRHRCMISSSFERSFLTPARPKSPKL